MDPKRALIVLALAFGLAACAGRETERLVAHPDGRPWVARVAEVPFFPQTERACGPASLAMMLVWSGLPASPETLSTQVYTPGREGSLATDMLAGARRNGRLAVPVRDLPDLLTELAAGNPVLVFQNLGLEISPVWHFAVAVGYDLPERKIILHSGLEEGQRLSMDTFEHSWERAGRWALVVLPPDRLPATATEPAVLAAAAGLERVGLTGPAAQAYQTALARWSGSLGAAMGLGNVRYAQNDRRGAEAAFRLAVKGHPDSAAGWNNLAHVLLEQGRVKEARAAADKAFALDGEQEAIAATREAALQAK
ncbi:MAG: PA2778 family cysteine peptidase [Rhodospirillaceae bacterium]|nr:PA2778 family cysteine peptidase [Rhodospirillales bacterium]